MAKANQRCPTCNCQCNTCSLSNLDLHHEIEELRSQLMRSNVALGQANREQQQIRENQEQQMDRVTDELTKLRDRYDRLMETYKKTQKNNHDLEDRLLAVVEKFNSEKGELIHQVETLNNKVLELRFQINDLEEENERHRSDCTVAVQLLQCKPSSFVSHRLTALPLDLQQRVRSHLTQEQLMSLDDDSHDSPADSSRMIRVPMPTFPPTAMVYSVPKNDVTNSDRTPESVPMDVIAKILQPSGKPRPPQRLFLCSQCRQDKAFRDEGTQTSATGAAFVEANGYPRKARADFGTNPPTIVTSHPGVHGNATVDNG